MAKNYTREQLMDPVIIDSYPAPEFPSNIKQDIQLPHRFEIFRAANLTDDEIRTVYLIAIQQTTYDVAAKVIGKHKTTIYRYYKSAMEKLASTPEVKRTWDIYVAISKGDNDG